MSGAESGAEPGKAIPRVVSPDEWQAARQELLPKEKAMTRALSALAAERRRLPMVLIEQEHVFNGPEGKVSLLDLFEGRAQLILYHFMFAPNPAVRVRGASRRLSKLKGWAT